MNTMTKLGASKMNTQNPNIRRFMALTTACGLGLSVLFSACATPEEINRTQPDLIQKSDLSGEWYYLESVVRAPFADQDAFTGLQGTLERGTWEIEEKFLYFYRTYEFVQGVESQGIRSDVDTPLLDANGQPQTYVKTLAVDHENAAKSNEEIEDIDPEMPGIQVLAQRYVYRSSPLAQVLRGTHGRVESRSLVDDEEHIDGAETESDDVGTHGASNTLIERSPAATSSMRSSAGRGRPTCRRSRARRCTCASAWRGPVCSRWICDAVGGYHADRHGRHEGRTLEAGGELPPLG